MSEAQEKEAYVGFINNMLAMADIRKVRIVYTFLLHLI